MSKEVSTCRGWCGREIRGRFWRRGKKKEKKERKRQGWEREGVAERRGTVRVVAGRVRDVEFAVSRLLLLEVRRTEGEVSDALI